MTSQTDVDKQTDQVLQYMESHLNAMLNMDMEPVAICRGLAIIVGAVINKCVSSDEEKMYAVESVSQLILDALNIDEVTLQ